MLHIIYECVINCNLVIIRILALATNYNFQLLELVLHYGAGSLGIIMCMMATALPGSTLLDWKIVRTLSVVHSLSA